MGIREAETAYGHSLAFLTASLNEGLFSCFPERTWRGSKMPLYFSLRDFSLQSSKLPIKRLDTFPSPFKQITRVQETARIIHWIYGSNRTMLPTRDYPLDFPLQEKILAKNHSRNVIPWLLLFTHEIVIRPIRTQCPTSALFSVQVFTGLSGYQEDLRKMMWQKSA